MRVQILKSAINARRNGRAFAETLLTALVVGEVTSSYCGAFKKRNEKIQEVYLKKGRKAQHLVLFLHFLQSTVGFEQSGALLPSPVSQPAVVMSGSQARPHQGGPAGHAEDLLAMKTLTFIRR